MTSETFGYDRYADALSEAMGNGGTIYLTGSYTFVSVSEGDTIEEGWLALTTVSVQQHWPEPTEDDQEAD